MKTASNKQRNEFVLDALERYEQPLTSYAMRMLGGNLHAARDVVQHTFMQLCKQPPEKIAAKLTPWLYSVCRNRTLDELKANKRTKTSTADFDSFSSTFENPADQAENEDLLKHLKQQFNALGESEREVIELWSRGLDTADIAEVLEKKPGTIRVNLHRAIKRLRQQPAIQKWLERATGHFDRRETDPNTGPASSCNLAIKPTIISEQS